MKAEMGKGMKRGNAVRGLTAEARVWCMFVPLKSEISSRSSRVEPHSPYFNVATVTFKM